MKISFHLDQVAEGAMSLEESILEGDEVCKDAVDTQDTLKKVFASMCRIQTEYIRFVDELKFSFSILFSLNYLVHCLLQHGGLATRSIPNVAWHQLFH